MRLLIDARGERRIITPSTAADVREVVLHLSKRVEASALFHFMGMILVIILFAIVLIVAKVVAIKRLR